MTICFYSPYIPEHFGGGEKHLLNVAVSASRFHQVTVGVSQKHLNSEANLEKIKSKYANFFNIDLSALTFKLIPIGSSASLFKKLKWTAQYDALYYVTDGSLFFSVAKNNFLHIQIPFTIEKSSIVDRIKLFNWHNKNTNSFFTKAVIEKNWHTTVNEVIEPQVQPAEFNSEVAKEKIILNVGRFYKQLHAKRQDVLIDAFKQLSVKHKDLIKGWKLILVGTIEDEEYVQTLQKQIGSFPIELRHSVSRSELISLYERSSVYWHATGYDVDEVVSPDKVEHFGISTVEAMAAGAVPIVHYKGGQKEILGKDLKSLAWISIDECVENTASIIRDQRQKADFQALARSRSEIYAKDVFDTKVKKLFTV